jgi:ubiquitin-protein ligase E3 C
MFAEELGGNASRKRAQENKERRKRLLQEQQRKAAASSTSNLKTQQSTTTDNIPNASLSIKTNALPNSTPTVTPLLQLHNDNSATPSSSLSTSIGVVVTPRSISRSNAVERAAEQRKIRASIQAQNSAAIQIQSIVRRVLCEKRIRKDATLELQKKVSDLEMVQAILQKKGFVPPSNTVTDLVRLFLIRVHPTHDTELVQRLFQCTIIPSLQRRTNSNNSTTSTSDDDDDDTCTLSSWFMIKEEEEVSVGRWRLQKLLESLLYYCTRASKVDIFIQCLQRFLLETSTSLKILAHGFMLQTTDGVMKLEEEKRRFDLVHVLRNYLLQFSDKPIPPNAESKREMCFRAADRERAGAIFQLLLKVVVDGDDVTNSSQLGARIVREIMTIPLLSWRLTTEAITFLAAPSSTQSTTSRLILLLHAFTDQYANELNSGQLHALLESDDLPITICGATGSQRLLANLMQCSRAIPPCNGVITTKNDFVSTASFFEFVAALVDSVPLGTFISSRESVISWHTVDGNQKPIVLSSVILEQCKALVVDSYIRRLFLSAINTSILDTDKILETKTETDRKHEKEFIEAQGSSAASLAAKEARIDRNKSIWNSSKWAKSLSKGVTNLLSADRKSAPAKKDEDSYLRDNSAVSRKLASGILKSKPSTSPYSLEAYDKSFVFALIRVYSIIIARWGGIGNDDLTTSGKRGESNISWATSRQEACVSSLFNTLCFSVPLVRVAWGLIQSDDGIMNDVKAIIEPEKGRIPVRAQQVRPAFVSSSDEGRKVKRSSGNQGAAIILLFLCCFSHALIVTDDSELDMDRPLPMHQIRRCIQMLKKLLHRSFCTDKDTSDFNDDSTTATANSNYFGLALIAAASRTMRDLYDRSSRKPMCVPSLWVISGLMHKEINQCKTTSDYQSLVESSPILRVCPYLVPFKRRLKLFDRIITTSRVQIQGENSVNPFHNNPLKPGIPVRITRGRILEDGLATMNNLGSNMRQRIAVQYYNEAGVRETGIDAGGLFKDFWTDVSISCFVCVMAK